MRQQKLGMAFIVAVLAIFAGYVIFKPLPPRKVENQVVEEEPRTAEPMESSTRFFTAEQFDVAEPHVTRRMTYYWFEPAKPYPKGLTFPLVIVLHGAPGVAYAAEYLVDGPMKTAFPAFVAAPQSPAGKKWAMPEKFEGSEFPNAPKGQVYQPDLESLPDVTRLVDFLKSKYPIDAKRIYLVGCSEGGTGVYGAIARYPHVFAGAVVISGAWTYLDAPTMTHVPLLVMHGSEDKTVPVDIARNMERIIKQNGGSVIYNEIAGMEHSCPAAELYSPTVWKWLFSQRKY